MRFVNVGRCIEMPFMVLSVVRSHKGIDLRFDCWRVYDGAKGESAKLFLIDGLEEGIHSFVD